MNAIEVNGLRKNYGNNVVLKGLNFNVIKGEIFGLLGGMVLEKQQHLSVSKD